MILRLLDAAIRFRWAVVFITLAVAAYGVVQLTRLPIDAVPDITNKQVQINTSAPAFGPLDMERLVTFPIETAMADSRPAIYALDFAERLQPSDGCLR